MSTLAHAPRPGDSSPFRFPFWWFWPVAIAGATWLDDGFAATPAPPAVPAAVASADGRTASVPADGRAASAPAAGRAPGAPAAANPNPFERGTPARPRHALDRAVFAQLQKLGIEPAPECTDAVFVRRVYLDLIGTLPTAAEARQFLLEMRPDKRTALIDRLLARDEFTDTWTNKWCDLLRVKAEFPINLWPNAAQAYHRWIYTAVRDNLPYDRFARTLLTANGSNFRDGPVNFYRAMQSKEADGVALTVALTFLGARAEKWPAAARANLGVFFSALARKGTGEWKEEIVTFDAGKLPADAPTPVTFPDGSKGKVEPGQDPRVVFADWLIRPDNHAFNQAIANRVWSWFFGRGVVHEADDFRADNPPSNPELLAVLERELVAANYDLRKFFRVIVTSTTYQLSSLAHSDAPAAEANFAFYPMRRLDAEVLIDALNQITGTTEKYTSAIPEPFTFIPEDQRSIALPDGSITSTFLETFGRPGRDTGLEAERNNRITAPQRLHLLNSTHVRKKIEQGPKILAILKNRGSPREVVDTLYYTILSRPPTDQERAALAVHAKSPGIDPRTVALDLAWALVNSAEFLHRH